MLRSIIATLSLVLFITGCEKKTEEKKPLTNIETKVSKFKKELSQTNPKRYKVNIYFITQVGCGACEQIKSYMKQPKIKEYLDKNFIVTEVDITKKEDLPFKWMSPYATPTLYFFDNAEHEIVDATVRRMSEEDFVSTLKKVIEIRDMD